MTVKKKFKDNGEGEKVLRASKHMKKAESKGGGWENLEAVWFPLKDP